MDASTIMKLKPELTRFLHQFDGQFWRVTRRYLDLYYRGAVGAVAPQEPREPMADAPRASRVTLQEFLGLFRWDEQGVRDEPSSMSLVVMPTPRASASSMRPASSRRAARPLASNASTG